MLRLVTLYMQPKAPNKIDSIDHMLLAIIADPVSKFLAHHLVTMILPLHLPSLLWSYYSCLWLFLEIQKYKNSSNSVMKVQFSIINLKHIIILIPLMSTMLKMFNNYPFQPYFGDYVYSQSADGQTGGFFHSPHPQSKPTSPLTLDELFSQFGHSPNFMQMLHELFNGFIYTALGAAGRQSTIVGGGPFSPVPYPRPQPQLFLGIPFLNISLSFPGPSSAETPQHKGLSQHGSRQYGPHRTKPKKRYEIPTVSSNEPSFPRGEILPYRYPDDNLNYWRCVSIWGNK